MKNSHFFVSCPPHLEDLVANEIRRSWIFLIDESGRCTSEPCPELKVGRGGISFEAPLLLGLQLNHFLRVAHRILIRWGSFHAEKFDILRLEAKRLAQAGPPWEGKVPLEFKIETESSRLNNKKSIEECLREALSKIGGTSTQSDGGKDSKPQKIYVRISRDKVTLSLDSTGEHLHKRGYLKYRADGSLRETLAHALLQKIFQGISANEFQNVLLFDPFMGSGTLLWEAALFRGPLFFREFSYQRWAKIPKILKSPSFPQNFKKLEFPHVLNLLGQDMNEKAFRAAEENLIALKTLLPQWSNQVELHKGDSLSPQFGESGRALEHFKRKRLFLVGNLPYGEQIEKPRDFEKALAHRLQELRPERFAFIGKNLKSFDLEGYKVLESIEFSNQGISVEMVTAERDAN